MGQVVEAVPSPPAGVASGFALGVARGVPAVASEGMSSGGSYWEVSFAVLPSTNTHFLHLLVVETIPFLHS